MSNEANQDFNYLAKLHPLLVIHEAAKIAPEKLALIVDDTRYTFLEATTAILSLAKHLRNRGVSAGDLVAIDLPMDFDFLAKHALFLLGASSCSLYGFLKVPDGLEPTWLVTVSGKHPEAKGTILLAPGAVSVDPTVGLGDFDLTLFKDQQPAMLIYTSGTTGSFKAVALSNSQLVGRVASYRDSDSDMVSRLSLIFNSGVGLFVQLEQLSRFVPAMFASNNESGMLAILDAAKVDSFVASPRQLLELINLPAVALRLESIKQFAVTGSLVSPGQVSMLLAAAPKAEIKVFYGANETGVVAESTKNYSSAPDLVGPPVPGAEIQVVDEQGEIVPGGELGIVRTKTPYMASEYHNEIIETAKAFRQGWFYPGDLGYLDEQGFLHLAGRANDVINAGGVKINSHQVEQRVLSLEGISDCAGVEVIAPSGVSAFGLAVVGPGRIDLTRLEKLLKSYFPFSHPTVYRQLDELPKNRNGKVDRRILRAQMEGSE